MFHKGFEEEIFGTDIIATENIVYAFVHLGHLEEAAAPEVSGYMHKKGDNNLRDPLTWMILPCQSGKSLIEQMGLKLCPEGQRRASEQRAKLSESYALPTRFFSFWQKQVSEVQSLKPWLTN